MTNKAYLPKLSVNCLLPTDCANQSITYELLVLCMICFIEWKLYSAKII